MTRYKLLVTDLDGTLLAPSGEVHRADRAAIAELRARGVQVSVCTGRMYSGSRDIALSIGVAGPIGCLDGSQVVDSRNDRELVTHPIAAEATDPLLEALEEYQPVTFVFADDAVLHDEHGDDYLAFVSLWSQRAIRLPRVLDRSHFHESRGVAALVSLGVEAQIMGAARRIHETASEHLQVASFAVNHGELRATCGMVVRAAGVDKSTALRHICAHHGVSLEETVAVGDWVNDVEMLRAAGRSFAMGQAPSSVKQAATDVLEADNREGGGIAEAAERSGLL